VTAAGRARPIWRRPLDLAQQHFAYAAPAKLRFHCQVMDVQERFCRKGGKPKEADRDADGPLTRVGQEDAGGRMCPQARDQVFPHERG
jgi:hypothetical protein